jgi:hypothetical protein
MLLREKDPETYELLSRILNEFSEELAESRLMPGIPTLLELGSSVLYHALHYLNGYQDPAPKLHYSAVEELISQGYIK